MPLATSLMPTANKKSKPAMMQARNTIMETYLYKFCMLHRLIKH